MKTALFIGRFQPFHNGHLDAIFQILEHGYKKIIIGIGSAQEELTKKNPFSYYERETMITNTLTNQNIDFEIHGIPDFGDTQKWSNYINSNLPYCDKVYSGNVHVEVCFPNKEFGRFKLNKIIKSTEIREKIAKNEKLENLVPNEVIQYLQTNNLEKRLKTLLRPKLKTPYLAVDGIVEYEQEGKKGIVLIERKNPPYGWALPGGFVDYNESVETALIREMEEEINLDINNLNLLNIYSDPRRDPRQHVASAVYTAKGKGTLKAKDDAKNVKLVTLDELKNYELAFDHSKIINDWMKIL